jgi:hypothetical protein
MDLVAIKMLFADRAKYFCRRVCVVPRSRGPFVPARMSSPAGDVLRTETGIGLQTRGSMQSSFGNAEKTSEFGLGSEVGCNPDDLRVEFAGYWSRLLVRVKERSEAVRARKKCHRNETMLPCCNTEKSQS